MTEFRLSYSANEINTKLGQIDNKLDVSQLFSTEGSAGNGNLFNKNSAENVDGYLLLRNNPKEAPGYSYSHLISIQEGKTYYVTVSGSVQDVYVATLYDADGNMLKGTNKNPPTNSLTFQIAQEGIYWKIVIPEGIGAVSMKCSYNTGLKDSMMVVETDTAPTEYIPYETFQVCLADEVKSLIDDEIQKVSNPLWGKKISLNGDSICYGAGNSGGYGAILAENNKMTVQNLGRNGATVTAEVYNDDGTSPRHWICRTITNMDSDADYAIVEGGVNDSSIGTPLGALTADYGSTLDDTTFYGAFESMLKQLVIRFAGKKVGYIAVHQMSTNFRASNDEETSYYHAAKKCCEKWGVPFLDLNTSVPPFGIIRNIASQADLYAATREAYTHNADGWHPNEEGYKKYYVPKIEAWLKTL